MNTAPVRADARPGGRGRALQFDWSGLTMRYDPYPIGVARPLIEPGLYDQLVASYPPKELFQYFKAIGHKYSLSDKNNPDRYFDFVRAHPLWRDFTDWIRSHAFIGETLDALRERGFDLGYRGRVPPGKRLRKAARNLREGRFDWGSGDLTARFEFSMLPADGGSVFPHTDSPGKIVTLVVSMVREGEWNPAFGGGTDVNRHKDPTKNFNFNNRRGEFEEMELLDTFEFQPNQAVMFIKTFNSWHSVRPMTGQGSDAMRRTLTINIERDS